MDYNLLTAEIYNGFFKGFKIVVDMVWPIALPLIIGTLIVALIKKMFTSFTYNFELATGSTKRQAKEKARRIGNIIDLFSTISDLINNKN